jgi:hypothetical protein
MMHATLWSLKELKFDDSFSKPRVSYSLVFAAVVQCTTSAFGDEPRRMLKIIQCFGKRTSCHLQGEYIIIGRFRNLCIGQAVGGVLNLMVLIGGAEERAAIQWAMSTWLRKRGGEIF